MTIPTGARMARAAFTAATASLALTAGASSALAQTEIPDFPYVEITPAEDVNPDLPNIVVLSTGGTITSGAADRQSYVTYGGPGPENGVQTLLEELMPELGMFANVDVVHLASEGYNLGSSSRVTTETLYMVSRVVDQYLADPEVDGVVVTAGTNVLEEDAYFLDLTVQSPKPVIMTGSMHQWGTFTFDGYTNLLRSVQLAASGQTTCSGTVVLMNDQFWPAREVTKMDGYRMDTFGARLYGPLGVINQTHVRTLRASGRAFDCGTEDWATPFDLSTITWEDLPAVDIVTGHIESTPGPLLGAIEGEAEGIVLTGHGPGGLSYLQSDARQAAIDAGLTMVMTTRTGGEGSYDGGGDVIGGADLLPQKARILLQLALAFSDDQEEIREWFTTIGTRTIDFSGALDE